MSETRYISNSEIQGLSNSFYVNLFYGHESVARYIQKRLSHWYHEFFMGKLELSDNGTFLFDIITAQAEKLDGFEVDQLAEAEQVAEQRLESINKAYRKVEKLKADNDRLKTIISKVSAELVEALETN